MPRNLIYYLVATFLAMVSCSQKADDGVYRSFDVSDFTKKSKIEAVNDFTKSKKLFSKGTKINYFFIQTESCANCVLNKNAELLPYFRKTTDDIVIIINDSNLLNEVQRPNIKYLWVSTDELKQHKVFHSFPWLYASDGNYTREMQLNNTVCDSLLSIVN